MERTTWRGTMYGGMFVYCGATVPFYEGDATVQSEQITDYLIHGLGITDIAQASWDGFVRLGRKILEEDVGSLCGPFADRDMLQTGCLVLE